MGNIRDLLNKIRYATYGKEVRQSIHDAIEECYATASVDHDNANMEVKMARGTHNTLNERFNSVEENIKNNSEQLEEKASKTDVQAANARIDTFTSLADGSTTGDAELIDGRTGADGITYTNIGGAIRGQYNALKESLSNQENDIVNRLGYSLRKEFKWHIGESYDINTGLPNTNATLKRADITSFEEMFSLLNTNILLFKNVNEKMVFFLYDKNKNFLTTTNYEWIRVVKREQLENKYFYFGIVSEISETNVYITGEDTIKNDIDILKQDVKKKQFIMSHFEDEDKSKVCLAISYDGIHFDRIGDVFSADETRDPCIIKHNDTYYLVYSHWLTHATLNLPVYKSKDLINWELHSTIAIDLSSYASGYDEIWAPEFFKDNNGTLCLSFASRIIASDTVNAFVGILNDEITTISNIGQIHIPNITNTYDISFYNDKGTYYAVCHSETTGTLKDTYVYKSNNLFGEYTKLSMLPTENYIEGLCIEKVGDTFYIYGDETVEENENPDHRQLVLFTSKDMLTFDRTVCGTNFRHAKIIKADETDIARAERAMIVKKYLKQ